MSEGEEEGGDKVHDPTPRRLEQAREKGDIPRSADAQAAAAYAGLAVALAAGGRAAAEALGELMRPMIAAPAEQAALALDRAGGYGASLATAILAAAAPVLLVPGVAVIVFLIATRGVALAPDKLTPKLSRISLIENAKQRFGTMGLVEFAKSTVKLVLLLAVLAAALLAMADTLSQTVHIAPRSLPRALEDPLERLLTGTLIVAVVIGTADFLWQRHSHHARLRMTREELKKETKESEGDPHTNARRRERAKEIATGRMLEAVPEASVVITNPTHYAVALAWDRAPESAPRVVAKGVDDVAEAIRSRAEAAGVPLREDPPAARAIYAATRIGAEIAPEHYRAVAAAILFADEIRARREEAQSSSSSGRAGSPGMA